MKRILFFFMTFIYSSNIGAQSFEYLAITNEIDSFVAMEDKKSVPVMQPSLEKTCFKFKCKAPEKTFIKVYCKKCSKKIEVTLYKEGDNNKKSQRILLANEQQILLATYFNRPSVAPSSIFLDNLLSLKEKIKIVLEGAPKRKPRLPGPKSDHYDKSTIPRLIFDDENYSYFPQEDGLDIKASIYNSEIETLKIKVARDTLVFINKDEIYKIDSKNKDNAIALIGDIITQNSLSERKKEIKIHWDKIRPHFHRKLNETEWYQLEIKLKNKPKPVILEFRFLTQEELQSLENFFSK